MPTVLLSGRFRLRSNQSQYVAHRVESGLRLPGEPKTCPYGAAREALAALRAVGQLEPLAVAEKVNRMVANDVAAAKSHHAEEFGRYGDFFHEPLAAAAAIVIPQTREYPDLIANLIESGGGDPRLFHTAASMQAELCSTSAAVMALLLQAHAEGLGACWMAGPMIATTPRAAKRFVNMYRLMRAISTDDIVAHDTWRLPMVLLALLIGEPDDAAVLYQQIAQASDASWLEFAKAHPGGAATKLSSILNHEPALRSMQLADLQPWIPTVSRYSFQCSIPSFV